MKVGVEGRRKNKKKKKKKRHAAYRIKNKNIVIKDRMGSRRQAGPGAEARRGGPTLHLRGAPVISGCPARRTGVTNDPRPARTAPRRNEAFGARGRKAIRHIERRKGVGRVGGFTTPIHCGLTRIVSYCPTVVPISACAAFERRARFENATAKGREDADSASG